MLSNSIEMNGDRLETERYHSRVENVKIKKNCRAYSFPSICVVGHCHRHLLRVIILYGEREIVCNIERQPALQPVVNLFHSRIYVLIRIYSKCCSLRSIHFHGVIFITAQHSSNWKCTRWLDARKT